MISLQYKHYDDTVGATTRIVPTNKTVGNYADILLLSDENMVFIFTAVVAG